jgi:predicted nucleotide-binding protein
MSLPIKTIVSDIDVLTKYFAGKPTGATIKDAKAIVDSKHLDARKLSALKKWNLLEVAGEKYKPSDAGRAYARGTPEDKKRVLRAIVESCAPYAAIIERADHKDEDSISSTDVAAHWHEHFKGDVSENDGTLNDQAITFFHVAQGAGLGTLVLGRGGSPTRFTFNKESFPGFSPKSPESTEDGQESEDEKPGSAPLAKQQTAAVEKQDSGNTNKPILGQGMFIAHGKNKAPLDQLKKILGEFKIPFKVAVDEPNLGRPIGSKVRETMQACNCAILLFTADEKFVNKDNEELWRPSENVVYELGACSYLYENRIVIIKEDRVMFPSNFRDIGYISFSDGNLDSKAMEIFRELVGFGILKLST